MISTGKILIVDDDPSFLATYEDLLGAEGYIVDTATSAEAAKARLMHDEHAVILLDQKLQGSSGGDTGLKLLDELVLLAPGAKILLVTAYSTPAAIRSAFAAGAYDYLEKNGKNFSTLLLVKVRNAAELHRERALSRASRDEATSARHLADLWQRARSERNPQQKGRLLEDLVALVFRSVRGFEEQDVRVSNNVQEIDIRILNQSTDPIWSREGSVILVECKNQRDRVASEELLKLEGKMRRYHGRCRLGFFVAPAGFTGPFRAQIAATSTDSILIVQVDGTDLEALITAPDRGEALKRLFLRSASALDAAK